MSAPIPLITGIVPAQNPGIHASMDNLASSVQAYSNRSMSSALAGPVPEALMGHKSFVSIPNSKKVDPPSSSHQHSHPEIPCASSISLSMARAIPTIESMSCRRRPIILP